MRVVPRMKDNALADRIMGGGGIFGLAAPAV
jgi:hypothetical protein